MAQGASLPGGGRWEHQLASFIACDGEIAVASLSCRLNVKAYPTLINREHSQDGISGVSTPIRCIAAKASPNA
jgi:hypothetical protein